jgi:hypothetical protein
MPPCIRFRGCDDPAHSAAVGDTRKSLELMGIKAIAIFMILLFLPTGIKPGKAGIEEMALETWLMAPSAASGEEASGKKLDTSDWYTE